ncbi:unnamed protein product [Thelazia callipaeda]|uniref:Peptidylglycine monooxygenase n=1 Tax=Thelazia callipaeda TaxID=103827 RepID=A0A0N5CWM1_THECL|nr:unnamed protein product [Thelazia callipaeda]
MFQNDDYISVALRIRPGYIVRFEPFAEADRIHHILLYGCAQPAYATQFWRGKDICGSSSSHILYAWARNAPDLHLPRDVAFSVGHETDSVKYLVMQVHYAQPFIGKVLDYSGITIHMVDEKPLNLAAVLLFVSGTPIPPGLAHYQTNMSCLFKSETPIHPFAFRTHTHGMGRVVSAFYKHSDEWIMIGKRNPQWPQLFEPIKANLTIVNDDLIAATCVYDSSSQKSVVQMGSTGSDEMCNFYMMFYWNSSLPDPLPDEANCYMQYKQQLVSKEYPVEGISLLPSHPEWELKAHQSSKPFGISEGIKTRSINGIKLGQVSGLCFDSSGNLIIFHRGSRVWDSNSFNTENVLRDKTPIMEDAILVTYSNKPNATFLLRHKYGSGNFYIPHSIAVDAENNYYTTDVGSHQVIKWAVSEGVLTKVLELGEKFIPGEDKNRFCKPAGVAVTKDGNIFVADGYCNNRIMKFARNGQFLLQWGMASYGNFINYAAFGMSVPPLGTFSLPHDIVTNTDSSLLYVADRENARIQIFDTYGQVRGQISNTARSKAFSNIYSVHYHADTLYFIPGRSEKNEQMSAFNANASAARVQFSFQPINYQFNKPHTIRVSPDGQYIYVGELGDNGGQVLQFIIHRDLHNEGNNIDFLKFVYKNSIPICFGDLLIGTWCIAVKSSSDFVPFSAHSSPYSTSTSYFPYKFLIAMFTLTLLVIYAYRRKKLIRTVKQHSVLDRAGFRPLRTDDPETSDDESEDDTIIARANLGHKF